MDEFKKEDEFKKLEGFGSLIYPKNMTPQDRDALFAAYQRLSIPAWIIVLVLIVAALLTLILHQGEERVVWEFRLTVATGGPAVVFLGVAVVLAMNILKIRPSKK